MSPDANPVKTLYRRMHQTAREARQPTVAQNNLATGVGKTFWALKTSADALIQAKAAGESLVIVYVAPQHAHIDITNHHDLEGVPAAQQRLLACDIPCVKVTSRTQLTDPDHPRCLYQDLLALDTGHTQHASRHRRKPRLLNSLQRVLDDPQTQKDGEREIGDAPTEVIAASSVPGDGADSLTACMERIQRREEQLARLRQENLDKDALEAPIDQLKRAHSQLFDLAKRAVIGTLSQASREGATLASVLGDADLIAPFQLLERQLFPLYRVMRGHAQALGLVAMTADRLMTQLMFPRRRRDHQVGQGDFALYSGYLEDAVHGLQRDAAEIMGLDEQRTRFLFLVDEADAVKVILDKPATSGSSRIYLRGLILDQGRATQVGQTLLNELPLLFRPQAEFTAIMQGYQALVADHPCLEHQWMLKAPVDLNAAAPMTREAAEALRHFRATHRLGTLHLAHHRQQAALRSRLLALLTLQYDQHPVIQGAPEVRLQAFGERLQALCQGAAWINLNLDDPTVATAGSTGAFTGGSWAFINLDETRLKGLVAHRDSPSLNDVQLISSTYLKALGLPDDGATTFRLEDAFETMLTIAALIHELGTDDPADPHDAFAILRNAYRPGNTTTSAPLTALLRDLSHVRVRMLMQARRPIDPAGDIDDDLAFRTPHLVMQWVPDFEDRYLPGVPGVSVVPSIGYRAWSAEHHLERLISPQAYRHNLAGSRVANDRDDLNGPVTDAPHAAPERPAHSLILISATGGFDASHLGGFCLDMLSRSTSVTYVPMSDEDLILARQARDQRQEGVAGWPGRPAPWVAELPETSGLFASTHTPDLTQSLLAAANTHSPYKRRELTRIGDLIALLSNGREGMDEPTLAAPSMHAVLSSLQADARASRRPLVALMLVQSLDTLHRALEAQPTRQADLQTLVPGHLYGREPGHRRHGRRPVLVITYRSGSAASTDAQLQQALATPERDGARKLAAFLARSPDSLPRVAETSDLLRRDLDCHIVVVAAYQSASRGINLKVDRQAGPQAERDVDLIVLGMSPFYSPAKPRFEPLVGLPGKGDKPESQRERAKRERRNQRRFSDNNRITHHLAFTGIELAARLNAGRWGNSEASVTQRYQARDIRLHPDSYLLPFGPFLAEQHLIDLARTTFQAVGRGERTSAPQQQGILVCEEVVRDLLAADPILYGRDAQGRSLANRLHAASLNSVSLMRFARERRHAFYQLPPSSDAAAYRRRIREGDEAFSDAPDVPGWKNQQLAAIRRLNAQHAPLSAVDVSPQVAISAAEAEGVVARWEAWHSPDVLFESTREVYGQRLLEAGVPENVWTLMWLPLNPRKQLPIRRGPQGAYQDVVTRLPDVNHAAQLHGYPDADMAARYRLPTSFMDAPAGPVGHYLKARLTEQAGPSLRWQATSRVLHPRLQPDFDGIWGELALDAWLEVAQVTYPSLAKLTRLRALETLGVFEQFDRFFVVDDAAGVRCLVAVDAKHYARRTDQRHGQRVLRKAHEKLARLRDWAQPRGYARCVGVYVNTQPQSQEVARPMPGSENVLVINAFVRIALTDANAPSDVVPARERGTASWLVDINHAAVRALQHAIHGQ